MDADSAIGPQFLAAASREFVERSDVGAVGGVFYGEPGGGLVGQLQRNEYLRYAREMHRRNAMAFVLTGTASMFRAGILRRVADSRGDILPGRRGSVYNLEALTEDNEITLAIKTLGYVTTSPAECTVTTEVMPTWGALWHQRMRWQRGAIENIAMYGVTRVTLPYALKQAGMYAMIPIFWLYLLLTALTPFLYARMTFSPFWLAIGMIFLAERLVTVWKRGDWRAKAVATPMVIEMAYDVFQQAVYLVSLVNVLTGREARWHHHGATAATA